MTATATGNKKWAQCSASVFRQTCSGYLHGLTALAHGAVPLQPQPHPCVGICAPGVHVVVYAGAARREPYGSVQSKVGHGMATITHALRCLIIALSYHTASWTGRCVRGSPHSGYPLHFSSLLLPPSLGAAIAPCTLFLGHHEYNPTLCLLWGGLRTSVSVRLRVTSMHTRA